MRFLGLAVVTSAALVLGACGGKDKPAAGDTGTAPATAANAAGAPAGGAAAAGAAKPITGKTWDVKMVGDEKGYRFEPAELTIKEGDGVRWTMVSNGPHNVSFESPSLAAAAKSQLMANMPDQAMGELSGTLLTAPNQEYIVSFAGIPAGTYDYNCTPHLAMNMRGKVTVQ